MRHYLREWLEVKGVSQRQLALKDDHLLQSIWRYCNDPHYKIEASIAIRIAAYLGITVEELYKKPPESK